MKNILVTGGAGFIGSVLVDRLILNGHKVTILDNLISGSKDYLNSQATFWELDILDNDLSDRFKQENFDLVYHLAAQIDVRASVVDPAFDNRVNVLGGLNVLEASRQSGVKKIIFSSTGGAIYGETDLIPNLANVTAALKESFDFFWVGFYLVKNNQLVLGPFQGPIACTRIAYGKGVCGTSWKENKTIIVPDVNSFPGHIACSSLSQSEIVIPLMKDNEVVAVLDVDSEHLNHFDEVDQKWLTKIVEQLRF